MNMIFKEYIRSNSDFKFERLDAHSNDVHLTEMDYDHDYSQSELENDEQIRRIIQLCKLRFPELKYKITKCVKTVFKEKFRAAYKKSEEKSLTTALMTPSEIKGRAFIFDLENNDPNSKNLNGLSDLSRSLAS